MSGLMNNLYLQQQKKTKKKKQIGSSQCLINLIIVMFQKRLVSAFLQRRCRINACMSDLDTCMWSILRVSAQLNVQIGKPYTNNLIPHKTVLCDLNLMKCVIALPESPTSAYLDIQIVLSASSRSALSGKANEKEINLAG